MGAEFQAFKIPVSDVFLNCGKAVIIFIQKDINDLNHNFIIQVGEILFKFFQINHGLWALSDKDSIFSYHQS